LSSETNCSLCVQNLAVCHAHDFTAWSSGWYLVVFSVELRERKYF